MLKFSGMEEFQTWCRQALVQWYNASNEKKHLSFADTFVVWSCKTLQNYKCLISTTVAGDGIYVEYTYNGDRGEVYEDVYKKKSNRAITSLYE